MLAYNLMSTFRQAVMRARIQPTLAALHQQVLAMDAFWHRDPKQNQLVLALSRRQELGSRDYGRMTPIPRAASSNKNRLMVYLGLYQRLEFLF
jgi:hypothetical protein